MSLEFESNRIRYHQHRGEFIAAIYDRETENLELLAVSIPRAGIFYTGIGAKDCMPDPIEVAGLHAETVLSLLAASFPSGPAAQTSSGTAKVKQPAKVHFMNGVKQTREDTWHAVELVYLGPMHFRFIVGDGTGTLRSQGLWEAGENKVSVPDEEPLSNWLSCWFGKHTTLPDGTPSFQTDLKHSHQFKTFRDIRKAIKSLQGR